MKCSKCLYTFEETASTFECRKCRVFPFIHTKTNQKVLKLTFPQSLHLTPYQQSISDNLIKLVKTGHVCVEAVCGAGKTEICIPLIVESLNQGMSVGWSIPRVEIVKQLSERFRKYFPDLDVVSLHGNATDKVEGDLIILTTHQLYRYIQYFDLLILDEPDAFPYFKDKKLEFEAMRSARGSIVYLSATYKKEDCKNLYLPLRPSKVLLAVPTVVKTGILMMSLLYKLHKLKKGRVLVFVPTRKCAYLLSALLKTESVTSETQNKEEIYQRFQSSDTVLICTSVLERGVTFDGCHVIVFNADHEIYDSSTLIQISGRVMRGMTPKPAEVIFICYRKSKSIGQCIAQIERANKDAICVLEAESGCI